MYQGTLFSKIRYKLWIESIFKLSSFLNLKTTGCFDSSEASYKSLARLVHRHKNKKSSSLPRHPKAFTEIVAI